MKSDFSKLLFDNINEGIVIVEPGGKILKTNRAFYAINGIEEPFDESYSIYDSKNHFRLHDLNDKEISFEEWPVFKALKGLFLTDTIYKGTNLDNGKSFYGHFYTSTIKIDQNKEDAILISITDIINYIKAKQTIEEKEKLLSSIINNSRDGIHVLNLAKGHYDFMSPAQSKLTGFPIENLMFNLEEAASRLHPDDVDKVNQYLKKVASKELPDKPMEYRWKVKSGEYRWFSDNRNAIFENGKPIKIVGLSRDITEKKKYEEQLKNLNELLTDVLYLTAHDIKSPIANIKMMLQLMEEAEEDLHLYLPKLNHSVTLLENVIDGIFELTQAQVNSDIKISKVNLKEEIELIRLANQAKLDDCAAIFTTQIEEGFSFHYVSQYIKSLLGNMISNAIKYRDPARALKIIVAAERLGQQVKITIRDNGIGMDLAVVGSKLFKPFSRFTNKAKGTGLGLYLINNLVRKNGGQIEVESAPGQGTAFICYLHEYNPPLKPTDSRDNESTLLA